MQLKCRREQCLGILNISLILFFDYNPNSHIMIRQLEAFPTQLDECWLLDEIAKDRNKLTGD